MSTMGTRLGRWEPSGNLVECFVVPLRFVFDHGDQRGPGSFVNTGAEAPILDHSLHVEILHENLIEIRNKIVRDQMVVVLLDVS